MTPPPSDDDDDWSNSSPPWFDPLPIKTLMRENVPVWTMSAICEHLEYYFGLYPRDTAIEMIIEKHDDVIETEAELTRLIFLLERASDYWDG